MGLNLGKTVVGFLSERAEQKFTARQIAQWVFENFPTECQEKKENSASIQTDDDLVQQIIREIASQRPSLQRRDSQLKTTEGRPRQYYWTEKTDQAEVAEAEETSASQSLIAGSGTLKEADLYPLLSEYLWSEFSVYSKRIDEKKSSNRHGPKGNKWLYPDIVGMENLTADWHQEVKDLVKEYADKKTKLWSFEVKILLNRSNVRESFFQAVSNSSWANFGYLAAAEIEGTDTLKELRMLFSLHGIGLIQIDPENPTESQILIPARERLEVDWATCNRLTEENKDFLQFLKLVRQFHQTEDPRPKDWDLPTGF
ncbi:MAG: HrgA protein [Rhodospirillaceae bacterium]|mgnify:CR=1 FL=1|nr:HrgA protein [Rhodospirillaceae bacterium]|tara:strand:+ start:1103 stop:2041 length:939 start_codon:yes stop_codon:yes gene_type:complete